MRLNGIIIAISAIIIISSLCGCVNEPKENVRNELGDEDWDYFVFHYLSGKDLHSLFVDGFSIVNSEISLFDPDNSSFLLKCNVSNQHLFDQLRSISETMTENISIYKDELDGFMLSEQLKEHGLEQDKLFNVYANLSKVFLSIAEKVNTSFNESINESLLISISNEMQLLFVGDETISLIMDNQLAKIINISDEAWDEWTKERDWSFMD